MARYVSYGRQVRYKEKGYTQEVLVGFLSSVFFPCVQAVTSKDAKQRLQLEALDFQDTPSARIQNLAFGVVFDHAN
ncbi:hypothetical protein P5673_024682 [Acropora cervicornis]|uniref:Uncharacterized protein n=1 Tax=Acropora cervicornis TaxID=6130 RepID=A0AAD9Q3B0_ACRCE|nr:hypothetical protein P5673_024682 [Acropora cervicornis]